MPGRPYSAWRRLARWLDRQRPDVVLLHSINSILPCRWYAWRRRALLVAVEHTPNAVKSRTEWIASRLSMLLADKVVVLTPEYHRELAEAHGCLFRKHKVVVIPNGIDATVFHPAAGLAEEPAVMRLGMAARFSFSKRQDILVGMMSILKRERPNIKWHLSLAGDGDRFEEVKNQIAILGLRDVVTLEGRLAQEELASWMRRLDIYVHASDGETLSTALLQAMATGLPIVASNIPGIVNLLGNKTKCGLLSENTQQGFAAQLQRLIDDVALAKELGGSSLNLCSQEFSNIIMLKRYLQLSDRKREKCAETF